MNRCEGKAIEILSDEKYRDFGPTLASEYLAKLHEVQVSKETVRKWMAEAGMRRVGKQKVRDVHQLALSRIVSEYSGNSHA